MDPFRHESLKVPIIRSKSRTSVVQQPGGGATSRFKKRSSADLNLCDSVSDLLLLDETMTVMEGFFRIVVDGSYRIENIERIYRHRGSFE